MGKSIKQYVKELLLEHPTTVVRTAIYQGDDAKYGQFRTSQAGDFPEAVDGVCLAVASEWISMNRSGNGDVFNEMMSGGINQHFVARQQDISMEQDRIRDKIAKRATLKTEHAEKTTAIDSPSFLQKIGWTPTPTAGEVNRLADQAIALGRQAISEMVDLNNRLGGAGAVAKAVAQRKPLSDWPAKINELTKMGRYYLLRFGKNVTEDEGHAIGFYIGVVPRLIDANSCDFAFTSVGNLRSFFNAYWLIYRSWSGTYRLDRYKV